VLAKRAPEASEASFDRRKLGARPDRATAHLSAPGLACSRAGRAAARRWSHARCLSGFGRGVRTRMMSERRRRAELGGGSACAKCSAARNSAAGAARLVLRRQAGQRAFRIKDLETGQGWFSDGRRRPLRCAPRGHTTSGARARAAGLIPLGKPCPPTGKWRRVSGSRRDTGGRFSRRGLLGTIPNTNISFAYLHRLLTYRIHSR
jgi:hypothetical protein